MSGQTSGDDQQSDSVRHETPAEQLDRNWAELLQELRVSQTGVQLITGFLLSLPFQQRFKELTDGQVNLYLTVVALALVTTGLLLAPVSIHRLVFRLHERRRLVSTANRIAKVGLATLALTTAGVAVLIFDVTATTAIGYAAGAVTLALLIALWLVVPLRLRQRAQQQRESENR